MLSEEYDKLKNNILAMGVDNSLKTVMVTSSMNREGSTTVAAKLALTIAKSGLSKIFIIDANFRNPGIHKIFKTDNETGLTNILEENRAHDSLLKSSGVQNLSVLTSGSFKIDIAGAFQTQKIKQLFDQFKKEYDYIIVDSPPVISCPETQVLSAVVDGVILVVRAGVTRREVVQSSRDQLKIASANLLGVVLNRKKHVIPAFIYNRL
ncbi:MAG: CpsD/CapB family tyrosine-protein kinase [Desulfuromonas sp.]|nr:CpsD/CapB family tyrosine-protein kinase [Desulfuromonas sp.]